MTGDEIDTLYQGWNNKQQLICRLYLLIYSKNRDPLKITFEINSQTVYLDDWIRYALILQGKGIE